MKNDFNALVVAGLMLITLGAVKAIQDAPASRAENNNNQKLEAVIPSKTTVERKLIVKRLKA